MTQDQGPAPCPVDEPDRTVAAADVAVGFVDELCAALGIGAADRQAAWWRGELGRYHIRRWRMILSLGEAEILEVAEACREQSKGAPIGLSELQRALQRRARAKRARAVSATPVGRKTRRQGAPRASIDEMLEAKAGMIADARYLPPNFITISQADELLRRGLVSEDLLQRRGIDFTDRAKGGS